MGSKYMIATVDKFLEQIETLGKQLKDFSYSVDDKRRRILDRINRFKQASMMLKNGIDKKSPGKRNRVEKVIAEAVSQISRGIDEWDEEITRNTKGIQFMHKHEDHLVVMIFGAVNTGKSYLGNFFLGESLREAHFDNRYKHIPYPVMETEEKGRDSGGIETTENGQEKFAEGYSDTTGAVQYFTMAGLRWMDSPGTGAVAKSGDTKDMDKLVDKYIPYTDMCIFLQNSSEPGLQADMKYIERLSREEQEALILITRSDTSKFSNDPESKSIITMTIAKNKEVRSEQEESIRKQIRETYANVDSHKYRILSISTKLAKQAVMSKNDQMFKDSNIDQLMRILGDKFERESVILKEKRIRNNVNVFINTIVEGGGDFKGIRQVEEILDGVLAERGRYLADIERKKERIVREIKSDIVRQVSDQVRAWGNEIDRTSRAISEKEVNEGIQKIIGQKICDKITLEIEDIIDHYKSDVIVPFELRLSNGGLSKQSKTIQNSYKVKHVEEREADGVIESFRAIFGKKYYKTYYETEVRSIHIDLGSNAEEYIEKLMSVLDKKITDYVNDAIEQIENNYFKPQEQYVESMRKELHSLKKGLKELSFRE